MMRFQLSLVHQVYLLDLSIACRFYALVAKIDGRRHFVPPYLPVNARVRTDGTPFYTTITCA